MRKLIFPLFISVILFFFSGCQSETPVSPASQDNALEKGRQVKFTGELSLNTSDPGFVNISLSWDAIKGAAFYDVTFYDLKLGTLFTYELASTETSFVIEREAMLQINGYTCEITIKALKERKGELVAFASGSQTFTYTGTGLVEITNITGSITPNITNNTVLNADWDNVEGATDYGLHVYFPWNSSDLSLDVGSATSQIGPIAISSHNLSSGDFVTVIFRAWNGSTLIGIGNAKFTYNP